MKGSKGLAVFGGVIIVAALIAGAVLDEPAVGTALATTSGIAIPAPAPGTEAEVADAAMRSEVAAVRALLKDGADVNAAQGDGMTALHWSALNGQSDLAEMLLHAGASVRAVTRLGDYTPLHLASRAGNASVVQLLVDGGGDVTARTSSGGATPLHFAAASASVEAVAALVESGAPVDIRESARGQTPLMFAAAYNHVDVIGALLELGSDVALTTAVVDITTLDADRRADRQQRNLRMEALRSLSVEVGGTQPPRPSPGPPAEPDPTEPLSYADLVGTHGGMTALLHAAREGHVEAVHALLEGGADINQVSAGDGTSPMLIAMINGHFDMGLDLLGRGADPNLASDAGTTPLYAAINAHWAPKSRYPQQHAYAQQQAVYLDVMQALLDAEADPNARLTRHLWFMSYNFDLLQVDTKGATAFWRAAYATDVEAMRLLVAHGADPDVPTQAVPARRFRRNRDTRDYSGLPPVPLGGPAVYPLHAASGVGYGLGYAANSHRHVPDGWVPAARFLIEELGADVNVRDHNGYTPLHHAAARGDTALINYLVGQGAHVRVVSRRGQTTADMANGPVQRTQPFPDAVALLESLGAINNQNCVSC